MMEAWGDAILEVYSAHDPVLAVRMHRVRKQLFKIYMGKVVNDEANKIKNLYEQNIK